MSKVQRHRHTMKPFIDENGETLYQRCTSCSFKCTNRALPLVEALPGKHVRVPASDPLADVPWDGEVATHG